MTVHNCPYCKSREIYFIDKSDSKKTKLLSFERGHTEESPEISDALRSW